MKIGTRDLLKSALGIPICGRKGRKADFEGKKTLSCSKVSANTLGCSEGGMALRIILRLNKGSLM